MSGTVSPSDARPCSLEQLRHLLRAEGLLASVGQDEPDALSRAAGVDPAQMPLVLAVAAQDDRVLRVGPDGVRPGLTAAELSHLVAHATGCETDIMGEWSAGAPEPQTASAVEVEDENPVWVDVDAPEDPPAVLLCRMPSDMLPLLARDLGCPLEVAQVDGWTLVRLTDAHAELSDHGWLKGDTPVVTLSSIAGQPYLDVLVGWGTLPGHVLTRLTPMVPTFSPHEVEPGYVPVVEVLADPHLAPDSQMGLLLAEKPFVAVDRAALVAAVQSPETGWHARVLSALGLPTLPADAFAGAPLPGAERVEPSGFAGTVRAAFSRYENAGPDEVARRGPLGRMYAAAADRPLLALVTVVPELVVGVLALLWVAGAQERPWWAWVVAGVAVVLLLDAVADVALMVRRLRRRAA